MQKRFAVLGALACALSLFASERAEAAYSFTTSISLSNPSSGTSLGALTASNGGVTVTFTNETSPTGINTPTVPGIGSFNVGDYLVTATNLSTAPANFSFNITDVITITNAPPPGTATPTGTLTLTGTVTLSNYSQTSGTFTISPLTVTVPSTTAGGNTFVMSSPSFSNPTTNVAGGNLSGIIQSTSAVPAPASLVMFGLGMGTLGLVRLRRRFHSA